MPRVSGAHQACELPINNELWSVVQLMKKKKKHVCVMFLHAHMCDATFVTRLASVTRVHLRDVSRTSLIAVGHGHRRYSASFAALTAQRLMVVGPRRQ